MTKQDRFDITTQHRGLTFRYKGAGMKQTEGVDVTSEFLGKYYFDFSEVCDPSWPFDENGVRLRPYPPPLFCQYHPMPIAEYALDCHRKFLEKKDEKDKVSFLNNAKWFLQNQTLIDGKYGLWLCNFKTSIKYNHSSPWPSAMSQGYGISVLLRAYEITKDETFLKAAYPALNAYELSVSEGGICNIFRGHPFYEEAPSTPPSCILNGFMFSLFGPFDFYRLVKDEKAKEIFDRGIETLKNCLPLYDLGYWSRYNLQYDNYLASKYYHSIHINQLRLLYEITGIELFLEYAKKWERYMRDPKCVLKYRINYFFYRYKYKLQRIKFFISSF